MNETVHDDLLFHMLKECKTLPVFLDHIFGFLKRRSDFYIVSDDVNCTIGLPLGLAESIVRNTYFKYTKNDHQEEPSIRSIAENKTTGDDSMKTSINSIQHTHKFDPSKSYNGAVFDNYCWSQLYNEIDFFLKLPENVLAKNLLVKTTSNTILVKLKNGTEVFQGELSQKCKLDPIWSVDKNELQIHFEKAKEIWWDSFLIHEPKLDIHKMECTKPLEDLPEDAQAKIQELQWNQEQKRLGLPTSDQINNMKTLQKAWNAEGSPFSGAFDPTAVSFN